MEAEGVSGRLDSLWSETQIRIKNQRALRASSFMYTYRIHEWKERFIKQKG